LSLIPWNADVKLDSEDLEEDQSLAKASFLVIGFLVIVLVFGVLGQLAAHLLY